ncbi:aminoacyl-histidine dipeptidase [Flavicella sediminum]|uniref:aminoacyl-histidine dipeptidase n=1 Tax=Flavicella sediminum TaxID=2585141 RepID=UPI00111FD870|nr:aminoacyl-histidine dipeptidase [Flavicella sediminum]
MNKEIRNTEPKSLWNHFSDINAIPRASKKEERIIAHMVAFGKNLGLETVVDDIQNVIIKKKATPGMENRKTVVLQSHLDMVHQKNNSSNFDFDTQGIQMEIKDGWIHAMDTTLGADNGIGVAAIMSILSATDIPHPPIEALFTIDEETGMTGAMGLQPGYLNGDILLNLDTEDDDEISIGCAGGIDVTATQSYEEYDCPEETTAYEIIVNGLQGGHSGMDIHKGLGNANKIMNRLLFMAYDNFELSISSLQGGGLRNAIPRESKAIVVVKNKFTEAFSFEFNALTKLIKKEFSFLEKELQLQLIETSTPKKVLDIRFQKNLIQSLYTCHNGVFTMNATIPELVETSNNLARVSVGNGSAKIACLTRSFSESGKMDVANAIRCSFELAGFTVNYAGDYPGWEPNLNTEILGILEETYKNLFSETPRVMACHAGLECGILGTHYPNMEMISFGPTIKGAHSPDEKVNIASTQKFWKYLLEILARIPVKS